MTKVKIGSDDHEMFAEAAAAAGAGVGRWLAAAGRRQALAEAAVRGKPGARIVPVPVSAATAALLDEQAARAGTSDWACAARLVHDVLAAPVVDPEQLWSEVVTSVDRSPHLEQVSIDTIVGNTVLLVAADAFTRDVVESRLRPAIAEALSRRLGRRVQIAVTVEEAPVRRSRPQPRTRRDELLRAALEAALAATTGRP
ncbi:hypothetical protein ACQPZJ_24125 [Actinoplanes sp. CA-054009]